jgi:hypothetical protein
VAFHGFVFYKFIQGFAVLKKIRRLAETPESLTA